MGVFGLFYALFVGGCAIGNAVQNNTKDEEERVRAKQKGDLTYSSHDGTRLVSNNHRAFRCGGQIEDLKTGEVIRSARSYYERVVEELEKKNQKSREEARIKGQLYYCWKGCDENGEQIYNHDRLVSNNMPMKFNHIEKLKIRSDRLKEIPKGEGVCKRLGFNGIDEYIEIPLYVTEALYYFKYVINEYYGEYDDLLSSYEKRMKPRVTIKEAKEYNLKIIARLARNYPQKCIEWIVNVYCQRYNIPMGTWEEVDKACLEEQPLGWKGKVIDDYKGFWKPYMQKHDI